MRAIGHVVVALVVSDQSQGRWQIQRRLGQGRSQEQAHLSDAERQGGVRIETGHFTSCGHRTGRGWAQSPPLSGSGAVAIEPGNDGPA